MGYELGFFLVEEGVEAETAFAIGEAVEGAAVVVGKLLILSAVSQALQKRPASGLGAIGAQGRNISIRQPISPWEIVVGRARKGGTYTFIHQGSDKQYIHMIITLAGHVSESIDEIWFDDYILNLTSDGFETSKYVRPTFLNFVPSSFVNFQVTVKDFASPIDVEGSTGSESGGTLTDVSPSAPASIEQYSRSGNVYTFFPGQVGRIHYNGSYVRVKKSLGDEAGQPFPDLVAESEGRWTDAHRQTGHTKIYVRLLANRTLFPQGVPNITVVMKGAKILNRRTSVTAFSPNVADWVTHYLTNTAFGF